MLMEIGAAGLNSAKHHQNDNNDKDEYQSTARVVPPTAAVRPSRQDANQDQQQNDN